MTDDSSRAQLIESNRRARRIAAALALLVPLLIVLLFTRQDLRLRALVDHGKRAMATVTEITSHEGRDYTHYRYEVDHVLYTWNVAHEDLPLAPGGELAITYLPEDPSLNRPGAFTEQSLEAERARLRPGWLVPLAIFVLGAALAVVAHRRLRHLEKGGDPPAKPRVDPDKAGRLLALLFFLVLVAVEADPKVRAVQARALGSDAPLGLPAWLVALAIEAVLFVPVVPALRHHMRTVLDVPERRGSSLIVALGLLYVLGVGVAWILYAQARGI